jgi:outer membrane immunogenic protein
MRGAGVNAGAIWGNDDISWTAASAPGGFTPLGASLINTFGPGHIHETGFSGGGQVGFNYQFKNFVLGLEDDIGYTGLKGTRTVSNIPVFATPNSITQTFESNWLATFRGRLGVTLGSWLFYGTGGAAIAQVKVSDNFTDPVGGVSASSTDTVRAGWTAGGGVEWAYSRLWSAKLEYLHVDLGQACDCSVATNFPAASITHEHNITEDLVRVGINYRFY